MKELKSIRRITVYADGMLEQTILNVCLKLGAHGYTVLNCRGGKGEHGLVEDVLGDTPQRVRIEFLVEPEVADKIMSLLSGEHFIHRPVLACLETVWVVPGVHF
jgi:hypothetical protein